MSRLRWLSLALIAFVAVFTSAHTAAALPGPTGSLFADSPAAGCVAAAPSSSCTSSAPVDGAADLALSPDGLHAYVAAAGRSAVAVLHRDGAGAFTVSAAPCIGSAGLGGCTPAVGLGDVSSLAVSPDGRNLYAASPGTDAIAVLTRNAATGGLTQSSGACVADEVPAPPGEPPVAGGCLPVQGLGGATDVAVSPDGAHVYVASATADAVALFVRSPVGGTLSQPTGPAACVSKEIDPGPPAVGRDPECLPLDIPLAGASSVAISPGGQHVYVAATVDASVATFTRDASTGALAFSSCVSNDVDGGPADLPGDATCAAAQGLGDPVALALSPNGAHLYAVSSRGGAVAAFARDSHTGALAQLAVACVADPDAIARDFECAPGAGLKGASDLAISPDGEHVYVAAPGANAVAALARDSATGHLEQLSAPDGCLSSFFTSAACRYSARLERALSVSMSPGGRHVLIASPLGMVASVERQLAPVCTPTSVAGVSGPTSVPLTCLDANGDALTYRVLEAPKSGSVTVIDQAAGAATYAPAVGAAGLDAFSFTASDDGGATGSPAVASLELSPALLAVLPASLGDTRSPQLRAGKLVIDRNRRVRIKLRCPSHERLGCVGTISIKTVRRIPVRTLRLAKLAAGAGIRPVRIRFVSKLRFSLRGATTRTISTRLKKKHVRLLNRLGKTRVEVSLVARDPAGNVAKSKRRVVLRPRVRR